MNESYLSIKLDRIVLTKNNPRAINQKGEAFAKLVDSVAAQGVIVPVHVRFSPKKKDHYELLAGERRLLASRKAGLKEVRAISHGEITDAEAFEITFAENFAREDLTPIEQGRAVGILLEKYKDDYVAVAAKLGKSEKWVRLRSLIHSQLLPEWKEALVNVPELAYLTTAHLGLIARFPAETQKVIAGHIKGHYCRYSVAALNMKIGDWMRLIAKAPFDTTKCQNCPKRSGAQPGLFSDKTEGDSGKNDKCLDLKCWDKKEIEHNKAAFIERKKKYPSGLLCVATNWMVGGDEPGKLKKSYGKIIDRYGFDKARKKDKGSVPAFVVHGTGKGTVIYVKVKKQQTAAANKKPTLKELRAELEEKRWSAAICQFTDKVMECPADHRLSGDSMFATALIITILGCEQRIYGDDEKSKFMVKANELYKKDKKQATEMVFEQLWEAVRNDLKWKMDTSGDDNSISQARLISIYFGIDLDEIYSGVCKEKEFIEPEAWKDLNADGTPKKKDKAKKKKTT